MARIPRQSPSGYAIFCDEIRTEITGKHIFLGVYSGEMNLFYNSLPVAIQRLSISVFYYEDIGRDLKISAIEVYFPGDEENSPKMRLDVPKQDIEAITPPDPIEEMDPDLLKGLTFQLSVQNMPINKSGRVRVVARVGDDILRIGSMFIHLRTMEEGRQMGLPI